MSKKQKPQPTNPTDRQPGLYAAADFVQVYRHNGERLTVSCVAGALFTPPASWERDGMAFITSDGKRILLPLSEA